MKTKTIFTLAIIPLMLIASACGSSKSTAEQEAEAQKMREKIEQFEITFEATYAHPSGGFQSIYLSPYYDVKLSSDTVSAYLPYYGRAYRAPIDSHEGGIKFTSTDFEYRIAEGKKGGNWKIDIRTLDTKRQFTLYLDVWENGTANLQVIDPDRQAISFQGIIKQPK